MNFTNNKKEKILLPATAYIMRKRWRGKAVKRKHHYWLRDIFTDKTDSQYNKFLQELRTNDREFHYKWLVTPFISTSASIFLLLYQTATFFKDMIVYDSLKLEFCFYVVKLYILFLVISVSQRKDLSICIPWLSN